MNRDIPDAELEAQGLPEAREAVKAFLVKNVKRSAEVSSGSVALTLFQSRNGGQREVERFTYRLGDPEMQAEEVVLAAEQDLEKHNLRGKVRYKLMAQVGPKLPLVIFMLYVPSAIDPIEDAFENNDNVDPSPMGREAMAMRHNEAYARIIAAQASRGDRLLAGLLDRANARIEQLEQRIEDMRAIEHDLQSQEFAKRIVLEDRRIEQEKRDRNMKLLLALGLPLGAKALNVPPELLAGLLAQGDGDEASNATNATSAPTRKRAGDPSGPLSASPAELERFFALGEALFDSLEREQARLLGLANNLSEDEQRAILAMYALVSEVRKRRIASETAAAEAEAAASPKKRNGKAAREVRFEPYNPYADTKP